MKFVQIPVY